MLYERLLERTRHIKIWLSFAAFEAGRAREAAERGQEAAAGSVYDPDADESLQEALLHAREVFRRSVESAKEAGQKVCGCFSKGRAVRKRKLLFAHPSRAQDHVRV